MRMIDRVCVKGSIEPLDLYTCDVEYSLLGLDPLVKMNKKDAKLRRVKARMHRDRLREQAYDGSIPASTKFETEKDIVIMRSPYNDVIINALI